MGIGRTAIEEGNSLTLNLTFLTTFVIESRIIQKSVCLTCFYRKGSPQLIFMARRSVVDRGYYVFNIFCCPNVPCQHRQCIFIASRGFRWNLGRQSISPTNEPIIVWDKGVGYNRKFETTINWCCRGGTQISQYIRHAVSGGVVHYTHAATDASWPHAVFTSPGHAFNKTYVIVIRCCTILYYTILYYKQQIWHIRMSNKCGRLVRPARYTPARL